MFFLTGGGRNRLLTTLLTILFITSVCLVLSLHTGYVNVRKEDLLNLADKTKKLVTGKVSPLEEKLDAPTPDAPIAETRISDSRISDEIFPAAREGRIPKINSKNIYEDPSKRDTPLFIGFTRNWHMLEQAVVSYLAAGWPAKYIKVVDNSGVMDSNELGLLSLENPWFLNHTRLSQLGVGVVRTPTLLTFAQLQNYYINYAIEKKWETFFWSHMDIVILPNEDDEDYAKNPFYKRVLQCLDETKNDKMWAVRFFAFDWFTLVNVEAMKAVGGWDTQIPYYKTDCDMYARLHMNSYTKNDCKAADIYDVAKPLDDLSILFPPPPPPPSTNPSSNSNSNPNSLDTTRYHDLKSRLEHMSREKGESKKGRNTWQAKQRGGEGEPFWRHPQGFEKALDRWVNWGYEVYRMKWGVDDCHFSDTFHRKAGDEYLYEDGKKLRKWD